MQLNVVWCLRHVQDSYHAMSVRQNIPSRFQNAQITTLQMNCISLCLSEAGRHNMCIHPWHQSLAWSSNCSCIRLPTEWSSALWYQQCGALCLDDRSHFFLRRIWHYTCDLPASAFSIKTYWKISYMCWSHPYPLSKNISDVPVQVWLVFEESWWV